MTNQFQAAATVEPLGWDASPPAAQVDSAHRPEQAEMLGLAIEPMTYRTFCLVFNLCCKKTNQNNHY